MKKPKDISSKRIIIIISCTILISIIILIIAIKILMKDANDTFDQNAKGMEDYTRRLDEITDKLKR